MILEADQNAIYRGEIFISSNEKNRAIKTQYAAYVTTFCQH